MGECWVIGREVKLQGIVSKLNPGLDVVSTARSAVEESALAVHQYWKPNGSAGIVTLSLLDPQRAETLTVYVPGGMLRQ